MTKFVTYRIVSTAEQGKSRLGLESQAELLAHYLRNHQAVADFEEVASAKTLDRPHLQQAVQLCVDNVYHLAVAKVDRLSCKTEDDVLKVWGKLKARLFCANLFRVDLRGADLTDTIVSKEQLDLAILNEHTIMPNGLNYQP